MTLPVYGNSISLTQIRTEFNANGTGAIPFNSYYSNGSYVAANTPGYPSGGNTATIIPSSGAISFRNFFGASATITGTVTYTGQAMVPKSPNGAWGTNPSDGGGSWPYSVWGSGLGVGSSGTTYYPYISGAGSTTLYYTLGCDNSGSLEYATTTSLTADPTTLSYTSVTSGVGFPGTSSWTMLGTFTSSTIFWFKVGFADSGGDYGLTFALSNSASSSGILITSKSVDASGNPTYTA